MDGGFGLEGRVIIVTGAGKGLGRAYARHLGARGAKVLVNNRWTDRSAPSSAEGVAAEIRDAGGEALACHDAVEDRASGEAMVARAISAWGRVDGVVANAGVPEAQSFLKQSLDDFHAVFDINFLGTLHLVHAAWPVMAAARHGRVIVSTSGAGLHANHGMAAYSASKAALIGLMRALALEGAARGITVNAIAPYAATPMTAAYIKDPALAARMTPEAVAPVVSWLASDACDVTGRVVVAGAGRVRGATAVEGRLIALGSDVGAAIHAADPLDGPRPFDHANEAFAAFVGDTPTPA